MGQTVGQLATSLCALPPDLLWSGNPISICLCVDSRSRHSPFEVAPKNEAELPNVQLLEDKRTPGLLLLLETAGEMDPLYSLYICQTQATNTIPKDP